MTKRDLTHPPNQPQEVAERAERFAALAARGLAAQHGQEAARGLLDSLERQAKQRERLREKQALAARVGAPWGSQVPVEPPKPLQPLKAPTRERGAGREMKRVIDRLQRRHERDTTVAQAQAERLADKAFASSGIHHHFRPICRVAWWASYLAGCDANGALALATLRGCGLPAARQAQVLRAALSPAPYQPKREVCRGARAGQRAFKAPTELRTGKAWREGQRLISHPMAIRTIQVAVFLWLSKERTRRRGYRGRVRGFGRGVFAALARCGKDAITGHDDGVPGALVALAQAGFIQYAQPPASKVTAFDRGPSGFAYALYWIPATAEERELDAYHERVVHVAGLPYLQQLIARPRLIEERDALRKAHDPPPKPFEDSEIPY